MHRCGEWANKRAKWKYLLGFCFMNKCIPFFVWSFFFCENITSRNGRTATITNTFFAQHICRLSFATLTVWMDAYITIYTQIKAHCKRALDDSEPMMVSHSACFFRCCCYCCCCFVYVVGISKSQIQTFCQHIQEPRERDRFCVCQTEFQAVTCKFTISDKKQRHQLNHTNNSTENKCCKIYSHLLCVQRNGKYFCCVDGMPTSFFSLFLCFFFNLFSWPLFSLSFSFFLASLPFLLFV